MGDLFAAEAAAAWVPLPEQVATLPPDWRSLAEAWLVSEAGQQVASLLARRHAQGAEIYPGDLFRALRLTPLAQVRVVILGQDPYHGPGQADGLAFSVPRGAKLPPSLRNIFQELHRDLGVPLAKHGALDAWAAQGVLLLNTALSVERGQPASHSGQGWESLTDALIKAVALRPAPCVFMLWGAHAQSKAPLIESLAPGRHQLLRANHPSPLSARRPPVPFMGCGHFSAALQTWPGLQWQLPS